MDHPVLGPITRRVEYDAHPVGRAPIRYSNTHRPAARSNTVVLGGKTGFNNAARYCLVLAAEVGGRTLGMAFLGTEGELTRFGDVGRVSDWVVAYRARKTRTSARAKAAGPRAGGRRTVCRAPRRPPVPAITPPPLPAAVSRLPGRRPISRCRPGRPSRPRPAWIRPRQAPMADGAGPRRGSSTPVSPL